MTDKLTHLTPRPHKARGFEVPSNSEATYKMNTQHVEIDYMEWVERFQPMMDAGDETAKDMDPRLPGAAFTPEEIYQLDKERRVWTLMDCDGVTLVASGYHFVNMLAVYVCTVPYEEGVEYCEAPDPDEVALNVAAEAEEMDARKLKTYEAFGDTSLGNIRIIFEESKNAAFGAHTGSEGFDGVTTDQQRAAELVKRWNAYPVLWDALQDILSGNTMRDKDAWSSLEVIQNHYKIAREAIVKATPE